MPGTFISSNILAGVVLVLFTTATLSEYYNHKLSRRIATVAWTVFAMFWLNLIQYFAFSQLSAIEGVLSTIAVPACLYVAYAIHTESGDYFLLTRAVTITSLIYFPITGIPAAKQLLIETVASQVEFLITSIGYQPKMLVDENGFRSTFLFVTNNHRYVTQVVLACSGLGSIAIITGLVGSVKAPSRRKLRALGIAIPVIWVLNLIRVTFIALAHGNQWLRIGVDAFALIGITNVHVISYLVADRILAQSLSVVALVILTLLLLRILPELSTVLNEVAKPLTGNTYDFESLFER